MLKVIYVILVLFTMVWIGSQPEKSSPTLSDDTLAQTLKYV